MKAFLVMLLAFLILGCATNAEKDSGAVKYLPEKRDAVPAIHEGQKPPKELKLTSLLYELAIAPEPERFAREHGISLTNGKVRVFISFNPDSLRPERDRLAEHYTIVVEKKAGTLIRALVPVERLIALSKESVIWSIRLPDRAIK